MALQMHDPLEAMAHAMVEPCSLFVVDEAMRVLLTGATPGDLIPAGAATRLPGDIENVLARTLKVHDFARETIASATSATNVGVRCVRRDGPAGTFYLVLTQPLPIVFEAVA